jgi:adenosylcobinamide-phosphate synthase
MRLEYQILLALALDLLLGDPRWFPHPVRLIGRFALGLEPPFRRIIASPRVAGAAVAAIVVLVTALAAWALIWSVSLISRPAGDAVSVMLLYFGIAAKDMVRHSSNVYAALDAGMLSEARRGAAMICGRDTENLDESAVERATIESVAENMVDGVTAPLFFAVIGGPVAVMAYKAINTLDSCFGYKNERYIEFGWASARLDDAANFIPARITALLVPLSAAILGLRATDALRILIRDRRRHPSPNAGQAEAAVAGALGVQLGGLSYYSGIASNKPTLGDPIVPVEPEHILQANRILLITSFLMLALLLGIRVLIAHWIDEVL